MQVVGIQFGKIRSISKRRKHACEDVVLWAVDEKVKWSIYIE